MMLPNLFTASGRPVHLAAAGLIALLIAGCDGAKPGAGMAAPGVPEVGVIQVASSDVPLQTELPGRTTAYRKAEVRPQVSGIIQKRLFTEGAEIKAGTALYQIDPATYQAALSSAQAELSRSQATLAAAAARESRYKNLSAIKAISQQDYDDALATLNQAKAGVSLAKAAVETANINLKYTRVLAPIDGAISKSAVTEGALVNAGQADVLASIQQLDPIYVDVSQSADELLQLRRQMKSGQVAAADSAKVRLLLDDGSVYEHEGTLQFAEVGVNESTGTVNLRAQFPNPDRLLLPGMFVRTQVEEGVRSNAILVSQRGITRDRTGAATAMVVNTEGVVELRQLTVGRAIGDQWLVLEGLAVGDQVIVEGLQKVKPGTPAKAVPASGSKVSGE
ncbi:efflux RND transporter periplasmic adaptor subunit [Cellvibrio sp. QJXJ]|uniref:efflux RND transporter periplasmic adaptor subunit n=1 Tax=Cellvibrio sp. QJXJ TaxID=2964606 RepID=UPI0021C30BC9|nr:efflux RND transporter periplasmic adaptor subunit [Cellvibrio sp. QJXJ]UUA73123.1 efflux RND transporter periplasmic adaptor subunit [Cellvibrio sp. QJXJ]